MYSREDGDMETFSYTYQQHRVFNLTYYVHYSYQQLVSISSRHCIAWFAEKFKNLAHSVESIFSANVSMADFMQDDWQKFNSTTHCHVHCEKPFVPDDA